MKRLTLNLILILFSVAATAQSVAINNTGAVAANSALLDVSSNTKGLLIPRMSKALKNAIATPATGLLIYQDAPDSTGFHYYSGTAWLWLAIANNNNDWRTIGNSGTDTSVNFIGTTDNMPIRFKQNNNWIGQLNANNSNFFIGTNSGRNTTASTNTAFGANSLASNITGVGNLAIGAAAMSLSTFGSRNTAIGDSAMYTNSFNNGGVAFAMDNTALGSKALFFNQPTTNANGYKNTAIGSEALYLNTTGFENTAVGTGALHDNISGNQNTAVGRSANRLAKSGINNTYMGFEAGYSDSVTNNSVGIGHQALRQSSGGQNTAVGSGALFSNTNGSSNSALGEQSLALNGSGILNTAVGANSLSSNTTGSGNTIIGANSNTTAGNFGNATAIGFRATVGKSNALVLGSITGINGATSTPNVGIGTNVPDTDAALEITSTNRGILIPRMSKIQKNAIPTPPTGLLVYQNAPDSIGFYYYSGTAWLWMTTATNVNGWATTGNTGTDTAVNFIGTTDNMPIRFKQNNEWIGQFNFNQGNYFIGKNAGRNNNNGTNNTAIGDSALFSNTSASNNIAMGNKALKNNIALNQNIAIGVNALSNMSFNTISSSFNLAIGRDALLNLNPISSLTGVQNTAIGMFSGIDLTTGSGNTLLGDNTGGNLSTGANNVIIGINAGPLNADAVESVFLGVGSGGNGNQTTALGARARVAGGTFINSTAVGYRALAQANNSLVLGSVNGVNGATSSVNVGLGTHIPLARMHVVKDGVISFSPIVNASTTALFENNGTNYIQLLTPDVSQSGIIVGNEETSIRSAVMFNADSSINIRSGGNINRITVDNSGFVGIRTTIPLSYHDVLGSVGNAISTSALNQTLDQFDHTHVITNSAGAITITLPTANTCSRREYVIVNQDNAAKTITSYLDFTGIANTSIPANSSITLQSNGTSWFRIR